MQQENQQFYASCLCGNVQLSAAYRPDSLTDCLCSTCGRYGVLWAYYRPEEVDITFRDQPTTVYSHGKKVLDFHHCPICGCLTHYSANDSIDWDCTAINARMVKPRLREGINIVQSDGPD